MKRNKKAKKQTTIEATYRAGQMAQSSPSRPQPSAPKQLRFSAPAKSSPPRPQSTFSLRKRNATRDSSDDDDESDLAVEENFVPGDENDRPPVATKLARRLSATTLTDDEDDDSDDAPLNTPRRSQPRSKKRNVIVVADDSDENDDEDDDLPIATPKSSNPRGRKRALPVDDEEDDDIVIRSSVKKRRLGRKESVNTVSQEKSDQLNMYSSVKSRSRSSRPTFRTEKEKQRELLRRRRAGEKIEEGDMSSSSGEEAKALYDTDSDLEVLKEFDDDEDKRDSDPPTDQQKKSKKRKGKEAAKNAESHSKDRRSSLQDDDGQDDLEDFVVEDDDGPLGAPDLDIPLEFTRAAHKSLKEYFRDAIEWLVHKRVNASFDSEQEIHLLAWRKLNDEVTGLANSSFVSSIWRADFQHSLRARPYIEHWELPKGDVDREQSCHACNRSNHPPTYLMKFAGKPYHKEKLEVLDDDDDENEDDSDENENAFDANIDFGGKTLLPESKEWLVGVFCGRKAIIAHKLIHWRRALQDFVHEFLGHQGWLEAEKSKAREAMKPKKRAKAADKIVQTWEGPTINSLWRNFKDMLDEARNDMQKGSGGRYGR